jgi:ankyrin repeat protein
VLGADLSVRSTGGAGRGSDLGNMNSSGASEEVQGDDLGLLDVAIANGHSSIALLLIERGCDVQEASKSSGMTPLYLAARCGLVEVAERIISQVAPSSHPFSTRATGTRGSFGSGRGSFGSVKDDNHYAAAAGASAATSAESQLLLAMVRRRAFSGNTALHAAVASSSVSMVVLLLASGADIMARGASYETCLHAACGRDVGLGPMVSFVLEAVSNHVRSDSSSSFSSSSSLPLTSSSLQDLQREMTGLRDFVALENDSGQTALHVAALNEQGGDAVDLVVQAMEAAGAYAADILNGVDSDGNTALHVACRDLVPGPALALVEKGCDVGALDGNGRTAFQALLATVSESSSISSSSSSSSCGGGSGNINLQQQQRGASSTQRGVDLRTMVVGSQLYMALVKAYLSTLPPADAAIAAESLYRDLMSGSTTHGPLVAGLASDGDNDGYMLESRLLLRKPGSFVGSDTMGSPARSRSGSLSSSNNHHHHHHIEGVAAALAESNPWEATETGRSVL